MPEVSVYLPDELYRAARENGLAVSALAQHAIAQAVRDLGNAEWLGGQRRHGPRVPGQLDTAALMDEVRDESGT